MWSASVYILLCASATLFSAPGYEEPWGKDAHLVSPISQSSKPALNPLSWMADKAIAFHTHVISPVDGPRSHFRPTSSRYMRLAIWEHGFFKGVVMGCDRLLRENSDDWVYRTRVIDGKSYKYDPVN